MKTFSFAVTGIGSTKQRIADPDFLDVLRFTAKVRTLGTNTYIALGDVNNQEFRMNFDGDAFTYADLPLSFSLKEIWVIGNNVAADGVLEVLGLQRS